MAWRLFWQVPVQVYLPAWLSHQGRSFTAHGRHAPARSLVSTLENGKPLVANPHRRQKSTIPRVSIVIPVWDYRTGS